MSVEDTTANVPAPVRETHAASADDTWAEEPREELPPRPRRRLLGTGGNPIFIALTGVLLLACGFIGGVLVEKGQTSSSSGAAGLTSRFAALRGAAGAGTTTGAGSTSGGAGGGGAGATGGFAGRFGGAGGGGAGATGGFAGRFGGAGGGGAGATGGFAGRFGGAGGATIGEVAYISGDTLYVTDVEGNTVKVTTSLAATITKTVKTDLHGIHPGETVVVRGTKGSGGAVSAESISVSAAGVSLGGGGLGALFGGGGTGRGGGSGSGGAAGGGGLFGG